MWNDFTVFADEPALGYDRSLIFGARPTRRILADASTDSVRVRAVVRAHQHSAELNPLMSRLVACDGVFRHWQENEIDRRRGQIREARFAATCGPEETRPIPDGSVWTFNVAPDSVYGVGCRLRFRHGGYAQAGARVQGLADERAQNPGVLNHARLGPYFVSHAVVSQRVGLIAHGVSARSRQTRRGLGTETVSSVCEQCRTIRQWGCLARSTAPPESSTPSPSPP